LGCKKCDRKKQQKDWLCRSLKKDRASPERFILSEGRGFFLGWGKNPAELPVIKLVALPHRFNTYVDSKSLLE
jgi:hypothetical protein